jgi:hypothetical protein
VLSLSLSLRCGYVFNTPLLFSRLLLTCHLHVFRSSIPTLWRWVLGSGAFVNVSSIHINIDVYLYPYSYLDYMGGRREVSDLFKIHKIDSCLLLWRENAQSSPIRPKFGTVTQANLNAYETCIYESLEFAPVPVCLEHTQYSISSVVAGGEREKRNPSSRINHETSRSLHEPHSLCCARFWSSLLWLASLISQ